MSDSFEKRLEAAEKAHAAKHRTGPLLTYPDEALIIHKDDKAQIDAATAAGRRFGLSDEPGPENIIYGGDADWQWPVPSALLGARVEEAGS
jgi:hypothetical protein